MMDGGKDHLTSAGIDDILSHKHSDRRIAKMYRVSLNNKKNKNVMSSIAICV